MGVQRRVWLAPLFAVLLLISGPFAQAKPSELQRKLTDFGLRLYQKLVRGQQHNAVLYPLGVYKPLLLLTGAARSRTAKQLRKLLGYPGKTQLPHQQLHRLLGSLKGQGTSLTMGNRVFLDSRQPLLPPFKKLLQSYYPGTLQLVDFMQPARIERQLKTLLSTPGFPATLPKLRLGPRGRLLLANSVRFEAGWNAPFKASRTALRPFRCLDGSQVQVQMMQSHGYLRHAASSRLHLLELPYRGGDFSMWLLVPKSPNGLPRIEAGVSQRSLQRLISISKRKEISLRLPRFDVRQSGALIPTLKKLGLKDLFGPKADLSGLDGSKLLEVGMFYHRARVAIDEKGTLGSGGTAVLLRMKNGGPTAVFADRPFLFLIRQKSGLILFIGRVATLRGPAVKKSRMRD